MKRVLLIGLILATMLAACGVSAPSLTGVTWTVSSLAGVGVDPTVTITANFGADGNITGSGGCNNYSAAYTTSGKDLTVQSPVATMMACSEVVDQQESQYFYLLEGTGTYEIKGNKLTIKDSSGQTTLEYTSGN
jgi:heat shock protein HslJ